MTVYPYFTRYRKGEALGQLANRIEAAERFGQAHWRDLAPTRDDHLLTAPTLKMRRVDWNALFIRNRAVYDAVLARFR